jgi:membrane fusion protein (multidrug efflux system)
MNTEEGIAQRLVTPPDRGTQRLRLTSKRRILLLAAIPLVAAASTYGYHWWTIGRFIEVTDDAYIGGNVTEISPHVSGFISEIAVDDNQEVHKGQLLVRLASPDFQAARQYAAALVQQAHASIASLRAKIALQRSLILQAEADLAARWDQERFDVQDATRYRALARVGAGSVQESQRSTTTSLVAQAAVQAAQARVTASREHLAVLAAGLQEADASLRQAQARFRTADLNLGYTEIRSPIEGYVGDRSAEVGAYVTAGSQLLSIVPAQGLWVDANFKEDEIAGMRPGQVATVIADVDPARVFRGHVVSLAPATGAVFSIIPPENATGNFTKIVQRVPVRIALHGVAAKLGLLRAGLSVTAEVNTKPHRVAAP